MRILLVNWQDREHPQAGGAEIHLHEIFGRIAGRHEVALLCGGWEGCPPRTRLDGIDVHRVGTRHTFPFRARSYYRRNLAGSYDVLVEDINKIPLYTPRWPGINRSLALVPHLFGGTAFQEFPAPLAAAVWLAERPLGIVYHRVPFEAISESTADDLAARGIARDHVRVIYPGIDVNTYTPEARGRSTTPVFAYLGRLKRYKGVHHVIRAFSLAGPQAGVLEIAGAGNYLGDLERLADRLALGDRVRFLGRISESEKLALLRRAWALVFASPKEGWGITNLEAAACGTPVIASNSPGICESVRDGETGYLVPHGDLDAMASAMRRLASSIDLVSRLGAQARQFAAVFTWERAAHETEEHLHSIVGGSEASDGRSVNSKAGQRPVG